METLSHYRKTNKFSKKTCNVKLEDRAVSDNVFGNSTKSGVSALSPCAEDYSEIFGSFFASRASTIPVLDLPAVDEAEVFFDVRSSGFDYSEVFGDFDCPDYAVSYDQLFDHSIGRGGNDSCEETSWTPAETESLSEESNHSEKNSMLSYEDPYQYIEGSTEFSISYHKANQISKEDMSNCLTHTSQLHSVPRFACVVDETAHLQKLNSENPSLIMTDNGNFDMDFTNELTGKQFMKTLSHQPHGNTISQTFGNDPTYHRENGIKRSNSNEPFVTVSEISLRTDPSHLPPPSRPPPVLYVKKGDSNAVTNTSEETAGDISPPYFDVEVDASSSAAVSAAAMKEAMVKAQARLKSAQKLMERKEGFQGRKKPGSNNGVRDKEEKTNKNVNKSDTLNFKSIQGTSEKEDDGMKRYLREERQKLARATEAVPESSRKELWNSAEGFAEGKHVNASWVSQAFELVRNDKPTKALTQESNEKKTNEGGLKNQQATLEAFHRQEDKVKKVKAVKEDRVLDEWGRKFRVEQEACGQEEKIVRSKVFKAKDGHRLKGHEKKVQVAQEVCRLEQENEKNLGLTQQYAETEKKLTGVYEPEKLENMVEAQRKEDTIEIDLILKEKLDEQKVKEAKHRMELEKRLEESRKNEDSERRPDEALEMEEKEKRLRDDLERGQNEKRMQKALGQEQNEKRLKKVPEQNENEKKLKVACEIEEDEKVKDVLERVENEKRLKETSEPEENEKRLKDTLQQEVIQTAQKEAAEHEENEKKQREDHKRVGNEKGLKEVDGMEDTEERLKEACELEDDLKSFEVDQEREENQARLIEGSEQEETYNELREAENMVKISSDEELKEITKVHEETKSVDGLKFPEQSFVCMEGESISVLCEIVRLTDVKNSRVTQSVCKHEENNRKLQATQELHDRNNKGNIRTESKQCERKSEVVEVEYSLVNETFKASCTAQGNSGNVENQSKVEDSKESLLWDANVKKVGEAGIGIGQTRVTKSKSVVSPVESDLGCLERKFAHGEKGKTIEQVRVVNQDENKGQFMSTQVGKERAENGMKVEASLQEKLGTKKNIPNTDQQVNNVTQNTERKENIRNETVAAEEKENEIMKRERALAKERLRKMDEEREREREREKDRMAVDRATLEACERAHTESRDRAEKAAVDRATAEFRQRALNEARERLEKACAEAREKSLSENASMETRLRAERDSVERATTEAREHAVETATARNTGLRQGCSSSDSRDIHFQSTGSSSSRSPYSAVHGASSYTERFQGVEGESVQRCRARLERHRRTAERAAKALAEKNMRDILAQREQAERNRFAETLDADVKRWSSGKEGNLRALLSTLQYILGTDNGWQPVPLTEVITAAAVKKAYRKATLCVHPDKLQQRRASIQQKYICEKVFDLLKEAWSRFNSEER